MSFTCIPIVHCPLSKISHLSHPNWFGVESVKVTRCDTSSRIRKISLLLSPMTSHGQRSVIKKKKRKKTSITSTLVSINVMTSFTRFSHWFQCHCHLIRSFFNGFSQENLEQCRLGISAFSNYLQSGDFFLVFEAFVGTCELLID